MEMVGKMYDVVEFKQVCKYIEKLDHYKSLIIKHHSVKDEINYNFGMNKFTNLFI